MVYWRSRGIFGARKKKKSDVDLTSSIHVDLTSFIIDHGQQPMKMHTEVTLLYKAQYDTVKTA